MTAHINDKKKRANESVRPCFSVIRYSERLAQLWGYDELWLHVNIDNPGAQRLYEGLGYRRVSEDPWWYLDRRYLLVRKLE